MNKPESPKFLAQAQEHLNKVIANSNEQMSYLSDPDNMAADFFAYGMEFRQCHTIEKGLDALINCADQAMFIKSYIQQKSVDPAMLQALETMSEESVNCFLDGYWREDFILYMKNRSNC